VTDFVAVEWNTPCIIQDLRHHIHLESDRDVTVPRKKAKEAMSTRIHFEQDDSPLDDDTVAGE
jgi:hypothetical protein